ncbi:hypothetical protein BDAP_001341 [Binucleata daphniae]
MCAIGSYINRVLQPQYNIDSFNSDQSNVGHPSPRFLDNDQEAMKNEIHRQVVGDILNFEKRFKRSTEDGFTTETAVEKNSPNPTVEGVAVIDTMAVEEEITTIPTVEEVVSPNLADKGVVSPNLALEKEMSPVPTVVGVVNLALTVAGVVSPNLADEGVVSPVPTDEGVVSPNLADEGVAVTDTMAVETATDAPIDITATNASIDEKSADSTSKYEQFFKDKANLDTLVFNIKDKQGKIIESLESYHKQTVLNKEESKKLNDQLHVLYDKQSYKNEEKNKYETEGLLLNLNNTIIRKNIKVLNADLKEFNGFLNSRLKNLGNSIYENTTDLEEDSDKKSKCYDGTQVYNNFLDLGDNYYKQYQNSYNDKVAKINEIQNKNNVTNELLNKSTDELRKITQTIDEKNVEKAKNENEYDRIKSFNLQNELASLKSLQEEYKQKKDVFIRKYSSYMQNLPQKDGAEDATGDLIYNEDFFTKMDNIYKQTCEIQIEYVKETIKELEFAKNSTEQLELCKNSTEQSNPIENITDENNSATTSDYSTKVLLSMIILHFYGKLIVLQ